MKRRFGLGCTLSALLVATQAVAWGGPRRMSYEPPTWHKQEHMTPHFRAFALGGVGQASGGASYVGTSAALGLESLFSIHPTLNEIFYGSAYGVELRGHGFKRVPWESEDWFVLVGGAFSSHIVTHSSGSGLERWRIASIFSALVPEVGAAFRNHLKPSPYTRWSVPVAWLISPAFALEFVPALSVIYSTPRGSAELLWQVGLGASWRALGPLPLLL